MSDDLEKQKKQQQRQWLILLFIAFLLLVTFGFFLYSNRKLMKRGNKIQGGGGCGCLTP
jgi:hypothetical protein